jgi:hypothetical protein
MLFNCLNCCKAISSQAQSCPYCMIETNSMVQQVQPQQAIQTPKLAFFMKRSAYRARKTAEAISGKLPTPKPLPNVAQIVHGLHVAK